MKLASFSFNGKDTWGAVEGDRVRPVSDAVHALHPDLKSAIAAGLFGEAADDLLALICEGRDNLFAKDAVDLASVDLHIPVTNPGKIICVGRNYLDHLNEVGANVPDFPSLFTRFVDTLVPHGADIVAAKNSQQFDFEGELCLVIGKGGRHIAREDALSHVFGWSCFNDGSMRDFQLKRSLTAGKNFEASGGFGPWIVTADEIPDVAGMEIATHLNGERVQHSTLDKLIFDIPEIIAQISEFTPLAPGDVISTGTPEGVGLGRTPHLWMKPGDVIEVTLSGIGTLRNQVVAEG